MGYTIVLPPNFASHHLRTEGRRFGLHMAERAEQIIRDAHGAGVLTDEVADMVFGAVADDIRRTVEDLPAGKRTTFDKAARRALVRHMKALVAK